MNLTSDKIKIKDLLNLKRNNMITVNPEYQRGAVWSETQQKKLIDSVFRSYPLPLIYFHHKKKSVAGMQREDLEVIDGQQRINALYKFSENAFKLFDPVKDDKKARFPEFIKLMNCPWARCDYLSLPDDLKEKFNETELFIVRVTTEVEDEARDLFIRLQAGLPLNAQEKRDAWPGGFTEFILKFGGKSEIARYPGHEFFRKLVYSPRTDRGTIRTICAQIAMLFFENAVEGNWLDISTQIVDEYYYRNLDFDVNSPGVLEFKKVLDLIVDIFEGYNGPKLKTHEAIHIFLLINSLKDDYTKNWYSNFVDAFDTFRYESKQSKLEKEGEYWNSYVSWTSTSAASASTIERRHKFFTKKMYEMLNPVKKDPLRAYGELEREIIFYRDKKLCAVCHEEINWNDLEIHHVEEHQQGGKTTLENGVSVHNQCHPKGQAAIEFNKRYRKKMEEEAVQQTNQIQTGRIKTIQKGYSGNKAQSPSPLLWAMQIPELKNYTNIKTWTDVCTYLNLDSRGDSARRVLKRWVEMNRPEWAPVPDI